MIHVGIDIGKRFHEATVLDDAGNQISKSIKFPNSQIGAEKLLDKIPDSNQAIFILEATGHYWLNIYSFLSSRNLTVNVINPIQSDALRNFYIRRTKTDKKDSFIIADIARINRIPETKLADENILKLQTLTRLRFELIDKITPLKSKIICILDRIFPEYETFFSNIFIKTSRALLKNNPSPENILNFDLKELSTFLKKHSRGRFSKDKAKNIKSIAKNSFGINIAVDTFVFEIKLLIQQIEFIEQQISEIDEYIKEIVKTMPACDLLNSISGISNILSASIISEVYDISRFQNEKKLVAYAGLDATVHQSGQFSGTKSKLSKRGSSYLRRALWMSANTARLYNPVFKDFYQKKLAQGKHPQVALGAVARKLTVNIFHILKDQKTFDPNYKWSSEKS